MGPPTVPSAAPVAQLDRASASGAEGYRFESCRARQIGSRCPLHPFTIPSKSTIEVVDRARIFVSAMARLGTHDCRAARELRSEERRVGKEGRSGRTSCL